MKWDVSDIDKWTWRELPKGTIVPEAGNARSYRTGSWRSQRPILLDDKCTHCLLCWIYCPDDAVIIEDEKMVGFDLDHCKGCGICAVECPPTAITMVAEGEEAEETKEPVVSGKATVQSKGT